MFRRFMASLLVLSFAALWLAQAEEPAKPASVPAKASADKGNNPAADQVIVAGQYRQLEETLLRIAQKMEKRGPDDRNKARLIYRALREAKDKGIAVNLNELAEDLKKPALKDLTSAIAKGKTVEEDLKLIQRILLSDESEDSAKKEIDFLKDMVKNLEKAIRDQKTAQAQNATPAVEKDRVAEAQKVASAQVKDLLNKIKKYEDAKKGNPEQKDGKPNDGKPKDGDPKDGKPKDGQPKDGQPKDGKPNDGKPKDGDPKDGKPKEGDPKDGKPKDEKPKDAKPGDEKPKDEKPKDSKPSDGKPKDGDPKDGKPKDGEPKDGKPKDGKPKDGQPKDGKPSDGKPSDSKDQPMDQEEQEKGVPGREKIKEAEDLQKKAEEKIDKNERKDAGNDQEDAKNKLEQAKKRLEEILRQMREEEQERVLADLQHRCEKMLQMQEIVYDNTKKIDERVQASPDKKPAREEEIAARRQSDKEDEIVMEADKAIAILEAEGSAVAFPEVFQQVRSDMSHVSRRLAKANVGAETQTIEEDIIASLKEMIEALKQKQQEMRDKKNGPPPKPGEPGPQNLIDRLAELRMIKALQVRVYNRTILWSKRYQGELARDADVVTELKDLAQRQLRIFQVTDNIVKGRNQ